MYKTSSTIESGHSASELRQFRRWLRVGYGILALLFIWNLLLSAGILMPLRGTTFMDDPQVPVSKDYSLAPQAATVPIAPQLNTEVAVLEARDEKNISDIKDLQVDDDRPVPGQYRRHTTLLLRSVAVVGFGMSIWGLADDCADFSEGKEVKSGIKCIWGAISTAVAVGVGVHGVVLFGGRVYDTGVVLYNTVRKRELEDALSTKFQTKVRHIADWDGSMPNTLKKRDVAEPVPVFGLTVNGRDLHFAMMPDENNSTVFRMGHGPGPDTESNRRLRRRNMKYNNQIFEHGGLDFSIKSDPEGFNDNELQLDPTSQQDFDWIYKQVECYLAPMTLGSMISEDPMEQMQNMNEFGGVFFQVLNDKETMTMAWGKIAPFTDKQDSAIDEMGDVDEGGETNAHCNHMED